MIWHTVFLLERWHQCKISSHSVFLSFPFPFAGPETNQQSCFIATNEQKNQQENICKNNFAADEISTIYCCIVWQWFEQNYQMVWSFSCSSYGSLYFDLFCLHSSMRTVPHFSIARIMRKKWWQKRIIVVDVPFIVRLHLVHLFRCFVRRFNFGIIKYARAAYPSQHRPIPKWTTISIQKQRDHVLFIVTLH